MKSSLIAAAGALTALMLAAAPSLAQSYGPGPDYGPGQYPQDRPYGYSAPYGYGAQQTYGSYYGAQGPAQPGGAPYRWYAQGYGRYAQPQHPAPYTGYTSQGVNSAYVTGYSQDYYSVDRPYARSYSYGYAYPSHQHDRGGRYGYSYGYAQEPMRQGYGDHRAYHDPRPPVRQSGHGYDYRHDYRYDCDCRAVYLNNR